MPILIPNEFEKICSNSPTSQLGMRDEKNTQKMALQMELDMILLTDYPCLLPNCRVSKPSTYKV